MLGRIFTQPKSLPVPSSPLPHHYLIALIWFDGHSDSLDKYEFLTWMIYPPIQPESQIRKARTGNLNELFALLLHPSREVSFNQHRSFSDVPLYITRGQTCGNKGETSGSPSLSLSSGNGGDVVPPRSEKTASSPTQRAENTRRERAVELPFAPCKVRKWKATASPGSNAQLTISYSLWLASISGRSLNRLCS